MGLFKKIFSGDRTAQNTAPMSSQFHDSENTTEQSTKNAPRRELVQVVLRDTMRQHSIPSDWIDCRILSVISKSSLSGLHVTLIVRNGQDSLLTYVPAFQSSFMDALRRFEPRAADWLFSLSWQFEGAGSAAAADWPGMPAVGAAASDGAVAMASNVLAPDTQDPQDDDMAQDLQALFAIRDAALRQPAMPPPPPPEQPDFQPTQPGA
ncbi:hypothetical protein [uncultured Ramlibacter sp.]|uniref:hypothetical protein n=1 Tax=uncultured Ramlibacter sp. TaxID=260755 RepID=UPI002632540A|nr:hypothetical protein [uncultured Ramlibacter sp.]